MIAFSRKKTLMLNPKRGEVPTHLAATKGECSAWARLLDALFRPYDGAEEHVKNTKQESQCHKIKIATASHTYIRVQEKKPDFGGGSKSGYIP